MTNQRSITLKTALTACLAAVLPVALSEAAAEPRPQNTAPKADAPVGDAPTTVGAIHPVAVEVFLSQACPSCPPAAKLLKTLALRPDIVALNWHVNYWDDMPTRGKGTWADPYAHEASGNRQRTYNLRFKKRDTVFTPQIIVNGVHSVRGCQEEEVNTHINDMRTAQPDDNGPALLVEKTDQGIVATTEFGDAPYDVVLVEFKREVVTPVGGGANAGLVFDEVNIVSDVKILATTHSGSGTFTAAAPNKDGCAVLMQAPNQGAILAARYCDTP
ncbi:MAG: DUF1223 domain-containing protein [Pseudomonadota bacterium]